MALVACGLLACNAPTDQSVLPPPDSQPFTVVAASLPIADPTADQPLNAIIGITFSDYPDPATLSFPQLRLGPRGQSIQFTDTLSLVDKTLTIIPRAHLLANTDYFVTLDPQIRSLAGRPLSDGQSFVLTFHTGETLAPAQPAAPPVTLAQLLTPSSPLTTSCAAASCHSSQGGTQPAQGLDFSASPAVAKAALLSSQRFGPASLLGVELGRPETSYLLRKLIAHRDGAFMQIDGDPMPPPVTGVAPLDDDTLRTLEAWILQGAN